jgi:hypothetical protein
MANNYIIGRTERVRELKALLQQKRVVYFSAFFYAGKSVLMDQLAKALEGTVLRFDMGRDDWNRFQSQVQQTPDCTLLIDSLHRLDDAIAQALSTLIANLGDGQRVVMAGRAQLPAYLHQLCATNIVAVLDKDFVLFDEEEIIQLFLEYGTAIKPEDAAWLKQNAWGWPVPLHITAQRLLRDPSRDIREIRTEVVKELESLLIQDVVAGFPDAERVLSVRDAMMAPSKAVPVNDSCGEVLASASVSCPPAIPIVVCGERIDEAAIQCFQYYGITECRIIVSV